MTDLTCLFHQCVEIVQQEIVTKSKSEPQPKPESETSFTINDTFNKEAREFCASVDTLNHFLKQVKSSYLAIHDDPLSSASDVLTAKDKNEIDEEINYKLHQMYKSLKLIQAYETKRKDLYKSTTKKTGGGWFSTFTGSDETSDRALVLETINAHRTQVLRYLSDRLNATSKVFESLLKRRHQREKQLNLLNFLNIDDDEGEMDFQYEVIKNDLQDFDDEWDSGDIQLEEKSYDAGGTGQQQLTQTQIQQFEQENQEMLSLKTNQLEQVERLQTSMIDIVNIQSELSFQLETQGAQIGNLIESHQQVELDVKQGNKTLGKALVRNKKGANMLVTLGFVLGVLVLFIDYVSF